MRLRRRRRRALRSLNRWALVGLLVCALATVAVLVDWEQLVAPAAVPAMAGGDGEPATEVKFPFSLIVGKDGAAPRRILGSVIPLMNRIVTSPGALPTGPLGAAFASLSWLTGVNLASPQLLLGSEIPVMAHIQPIASASSIELPILAPELPQVQLPTDSKPASGPEIDQNPATPATGSNAKPLVGIYHTHARESFLPNLPELKNRDNIEAAFTTDLKRSIVAVGDELATQLEKKYGIKSVHSSVIHDQPGDLGAYTRSGQTAEKMLKDNPSIKILLDIHRDSALRTQTVVKIKGSDAARVLLVVGTNKTLPHPNWQQNYAFAAQLTAVMEGLFPGLSRGTITKSERYNQHLLPQAMLIEVGGPENSLEEAKRTASYLADVLALILSGKTPSTAGN